MIVIKPEGARMDAATKAELRNNTTAIERLTQGLTLVVESLQAMSEQIRDIHEAVTAERPPSELAAALQTFSGSMDAFVDALDRQGERMDRMSDTMAGLPTEIEQATNRGTVKGLRAAMSNSAESN